MTDREKIDKIKRLVLDFRLGITVDMDYKFGTSKYQELEEQYKLIDSLYHQICEIDGGGK